MFRTTSFSWGKKDLFINLCDEKKGIKYNGILLLENTTNSIPTIWVLCKDFKSDTGISGVKAHVLFIDRLFALKSKGGKKVNHFKKKIFFNICKEWQR